MRAALLAGGAFLAGGRQRALRALGRGLSPTAVRAPPRQQRSEVATTFPERSKTVPAPRMTSSTIGKKASPCENRGPGMVTMHFHWIPAFVG